MRGELGVGSGDGDRGNVEAIPSERGAGASLHDRLGSADDDEDGRSVEAVLSEPYQTSESSDDTRDAVRSFADEEFGRDPKSALQLAEKNDQMYLGMEAQPSAKATKG